VLKAKTDVEGREEVRLKVVRESETEHPIRVREDKLIHRLAARALIKYVVADKSNAMCWLLMCFSV